MIIPDVVTPLFCSLAHACPPVSATCSDDVTGNVFTLAGQATPLAERYPKI